MGQEGPRWQTLDLIGRKSMWNRLRHLRSLAPLPRLRSKSQTLNPPSQPEMCKHLDPGDCVVCALEKIVYPGLSRMGLSAVELASAENARSRAHRISGLPRNHRGALRLFRAWKVAANSGYLHAMHRGYTWTGGENVADMSTLNAGFYGFYNLTELWGQEPRWVIASQTGAKVLDPAEVFDDPRTARHYYIALGTFLGYGHVRKATFGARVEFAVPEYLFLPRLTPADYGLRMSIEEARYGMKIRDIATAAEVATGYVPYCRGEPIK